MATRYNVQSVIAEASGRVATVLATAKRWAEWRLQQSDADELGPQERALLDAIEALKR